MEIIKAKKAGFCFGVERALDIAIKSTKESDEIYSYGQLIHNNQVSEKLSEDGLVEIESLDDVNSCDMIIRSHGVGRDIYLRSQEKNINVIDCTCPFVKKVHKIVDESYKNGYQIIIVGNKDHPEVIGIDGWCDNKSIIIYDIDNLPEFDNNKKYCVVAQTTLKEKVWHNITKELENKIKEIVIYNTICSATSERQNAVIELSKRVDCMIVIGGYHSSNTKKLYELSKKYCKKAIHIEEKSEIVVTEIKKCGIIGLTAGASTPDWIIDEVYNYIKSI